MRHINVASLIQGYRNANSTIISYVSLFLLFSFLPLPVLFYSFLLLYSYTALFLSFLFFLFFSFFIYYFVYLSPYDILLPFLSLFYFRFFSLEDRSSVTPMVALTCVQIPARNTAWQIDISRACLSFSAGVSLFGRSNWHLPCAIGLNAPTRRIREMPARISAAYQFLYKGTWGFRHDLNWYPIFCRRSTNGWQLAAESPENHPLQRNRFLHF